MKLYSGKVKLIAQELARELIKGEHIEVEEEKQPEVVLDIESVLREYMRTEREVNDEARSLLEKRGLDFSSFGRLKRDVAKRHGFGLGEEALDWILNQLIEMLMHTVHIEEVWAEDHELRRAMRPVLRKNMEVESELDEEVRKRIKNLNEGSDAWDIKYQQVMSQIKRDRGMTD